VKQAGAVLGSPQMATIAVHRESGTKYVVLGGSIRMFTPSHPLAVAGRRNRELESPKPVAVTMIALCDAEGTIVWFRSEEMLVTEVDGASPSALLTKDGGYR
jgi:hypothetical protein